MFKALSTAFAAVFALLQANAGSFSPDGSIEGASGTLKLNQSCLIDFMNGEGDKFEFHVACSHPERKWLSGGMMEGKKLQSDSSAKKTTLSATIPALGKDPAAPFTLSLSESANGLARVEALFSCAGDAGRIYNAKLKIHLREDFTAEGRMMLVDGSPLAFENDASSQKAKALYSGSPKEITYQMAPGRLFRLLPFNSARTVVSQLYDTRTSKYYTEILFEMGAGNQIGVDVDLGQKAAIAKANVYEGIDFNANRFLVPNYNLSRNLVQNPGFEDGFDYWNYYSLGRLTQTHIFEHYSIDEANAYEGKRSLKIMAEAGQFPTPPATFAIPLQPGVPYTFSFYAKTDKPGTATLSCGGTTDVWGSFIVAKPNKPGPAPESKIAAPDVLKTFLNGDKSRFEIGPEWRRYSYSFTPVNKAATFFIGADSPKEDCTVWVDAIQLEKAGEPSPFTCNPVSFSLATARRDNLFQPGEATDAKLRIHTAKSLEKGTVDLSVKDFFGKVERTETVPFATDASGIALIPVPWADALPSGMHIFDAVLKLNSGFSDRRFARIVKMKFLHNDFAHKNLFCTGAGDGRMDNWERKFEFWERCGFGAAVHFDPPPQQYYELMAKHRILTFSSIFDGGGRALNKKFRLDRKPETGAKEKWILDITPDDLAAIEEEAFQKAKLHPEIKEWKTINEPLEIPSDAEMAMSIKVVAAARKGILRASPGARIISPDPANMAPNAGIKYLGRYFESGGKELTDIVGIHPYRQHPEDPDLDEDIKAMIAVADKSFGKGVEIWFTEGMYFMDHNLPAFMLDAFGSPCGGDHSRLKCFSYDLGVGERMSAANSARYWLITLKYADRVKVSVDWSAFSGRIYNGMDMTPQSLAFASNTLANLLGNSKFISDVDFGESIRCYVFDNGQGVPVAALWNFNGDVAKGSAPAPKLKLNALPASAKLVSFMNADIPRPEDGLLDIGPFPVFIVGERGSAQSFIESLGKLQVTGANVKHVNFLAKFDSPEKVNLKVANLLSKQQGGQLKLTQDGKAIFNGKVSLKGKEAFEFIANVPENTGTLKKTSFAMAFDSDLGGETETANVDFEYFACAKAAAPIVIDGNPGKWAKRPALKLDRLVEWSLSATDVAKGVKLKPYGGEQDLSGRMWTAWDSEFLYVAFEVKDDRIAVAGSVNNAWQGDSIQLYIDSWGDARSKGLKGYDHNDQSYQIWFDKDCKETKFFRLVAPEWQLAFTRQGIVKNTKEAVSKTADGYFIEMAIPKKELAPLALERGMSFGFAAMVNDNDGVWRQRALTTTPAGTEPYLNPKLYPIMILVEK